MTSKLSNSNSFEEDKFVASYLITLVFFTHCLFKVKFSLSILIALLSTATISQVFCSFAAA
ncbi:MAG: hypothetical protein LBF15_06840 [Candidatus Peribacteria bacterium]|jgi:hypothetical protein|nr:hypothetical protein [Candidatus Peribacteria bacterium]